MSLLRSVLLASMVLIQGGWAQGPEVATPMKVELDAFSGHPNPSWDLSPEETAELAGRLADLPSCPQGPPEPGLGYRGFVLSSEIRKIRVYRGVLAVAEGKDTRYYADANRIELWLAEQAKRRGFGDLVTDVAGESSPPG